MVMIQLVRIKMDIPVENRVEFSNRAFRDLLVSRVRIIPKPWIMSAMATRPMPPQDIFEDVGSGGGHLDTLPVC